MQSPLKLRSHYKCESPTEVVYKPIFQVCIRERKSEKLLIKSKSPSLSPNNQGLQKSVPQCDNPRPRPQSSKISDSLQRSPMLKDSRPQSCKLNPVITSTLSSSYRRSTKVYITNSDITSFLRKKKIQMSRNIFITGRNCLLPFSRNV